MEFADVVPDIVVGRITQQIQFCLARTQDDSIRTDQVQSDGRIVEEVGGVVFARADRGFGPLAVSDVSRDCTVVFVTFIQQIIDGDLGLEDLPALRDKARFKRE